MPLLCGSVFCAGIHEIFVKLMKNGGREGRKGEGGPMREKERSSKEREAPGRIKCFLKG